MNDYKYSDLSKEIIGAAFEVHNTLGSGFLEKVYQNALMVELKLRKIGIEPGGYFPVTAHRQESVDDPVRFAGIAAGHEKPGKEFDIPVIYPIHPRSRKRIQEFGIHMNGSTRLMGPVDFLNLERSARPVLTDSGAVQEERCMLDVPCVTMRDDTERHETVEVGANVLASGAGRIVECASEMSGRERTWENPFWDGDYWIGAGDAVFKGILSGSGIAFRADTVDDHADTGGKFYGVYRDNTTFDGEVVE